MESHWISSHWKHGQASLVSSVWYAISLILGDDGLWHSLGQDHWRLGVWTPSWLHVGISSFDYNKTVIISITLSWILWAILADIKFEGDTGPPPQIWSQLGLKWEWPWKPQACSSREVSQMKAILWDCPLRPYSWPNSSLSQSKFTYKKTNTMLSFKIFVK